MSHWFLELVSMKVGKNMLMLMDFGKLTNCHSRPSINDLLSASSYLHIINQYEFCKLIQLCPYTVTCIIVVDIIIIVLHLAKYVMCQERIKVSNEHSNTWFNLKLKVGLDM